MLDVYYLHARFMILEVLENIFRV